MKANMKRKFVSGGADGWLVAAIGFIILSVVAGALAVWVYILYSNEKTDVDSKIAIAVNEAKKEQSSEDFEKFQEQMKSPNLEFVGPSDYGRVSFMYPRNWSVYVDNDASDRRDYKAYFHPVQIPPVSKNTSYFAMRLEILNKDYDDVIEEYAERLKKGELTSSSPDYNGNSTVRFDGAFSKELRGAVVLMRNRDKTIRFSTDADVFKPDFESVLETINVVQ